MHLKSTSVNLLTTLTQPFAMHVKAPICLQLINSIVDLLFQTVNLWTMLIKQNVESAIQISFSQIHQLKLNALMTLSTALILIWEMAQQQELMPHVSQIAHFVSMDISAME